MKIDESSIRAQFQAELKKYNERFGADGAAYFAEGLNFTAALERHVGKLETDLKAALTAKEAAEAKLAKLNIGEVEGVDTGTLSNKARPARIHSKRDFKVSSEVETLHPRTANYQLRPRVPRSSL